MESGISVIFLVYCLLLYAGLGCWVLPFFSTSTLLERLGFLLVIGLGISALLATIGYVGGLTTQSLFAALTLLALGGWAIGLGRRRRPLTPARPHPGSAPLVLSLVLAVAVLLAPSLVGGLQFNLSHSNHHDTFNYLESAMSYARLSRAQVQHGDLSELVAAGGFPYARDALQFRPTIVILYATLSHFAFAHFVGLHHYFLLGLLAIAMVALAGLLEQLAPEHPPWLSVLLASAVMLGFWGQYILDIDAWSQAGWMPLALFSLRLPLSAMGAQAREADPGARTGAPREFAILWLLVFVASIYFYPEGVSFFLMPLLVLLGGAALALGFGRTTRWLLICALPAALLLWPVFESNVRFAFVQYKYALGSVDWWAYYVTYLGGRDGWNPGLFPTLADGAAGLLGFYFATPAAGADPVAAGLVRSGWLVFFLGFGVASAAGLWRRLADRRMRLALFTAGGIFAAEILFLYWRRQYWTTGKALSFFLPIALGAGLAGALSFPVTWRGWAGAGRLTAVALAAASLAFGLQRIALARQPSGVPHAAPYPPNSTNDLFKTTFDYADLSFLRALKPDDMVMVDIDNNWVDSFARQELLAHGIRFYVHGPVQINARTADRLPAMAPAVPATAVLTVGVDFRRALPAHLELKRP